MKINASVRQLALLTAGFVVVIFVFVATYAITQHNPKPHKLRVAVAPALVAPVVQQTMDKNGVAGMFELHAYATADEAKAAILDRTVYGAYLPSLTTKRRRRRCAAHVTDDVNPFLVIHHNETETHHLHRLKLTYPSSSRPLSA